MRIGVIGSSRKENERRVPIYPEHLEWIDARIRRHLFFQAGYGLPWGLPDEYFVKMAGGIDCRDSLFSCCDVILLLKSTVSDMRLLREGQTLWGWAHCVQQREITQTAVDQKLTIIAWEAMNNWNAIGQKLMHIFYKNNELAGYSAILHALQLLGIDGHYGPRRKVVVISFGSVSKGAIYALHGRGFNNIHVFTKRPVHLVGDQNPDVYYNQFIVDEKGDVSAKFLDGTTKPFIEVLRDADIIVNGILQDTDNPILFVKADEIHNLKRRSLIVDVSCDEGMAFPFAKPTTFEFPVFTVGSDVTYYSVDHTASYLWDAASREISKALFPFLETILAGPTAWMDDATIRNAVEIQNGVILNKKILTFQKRSAS
jgi:alanine dehydrogenase